MDDNFVLVHSNLTKETTTDTKETYYLVYNIDTTKDGTATFKMTEGTDFASNEIEESPKTESLTFNIDNTRPTITDVSYYHVINGTKNSTKTTNLIFKKEEVIRIETTFNEPMSSSIVPKIKIYDAINSNNLREDPTDMTISDDNTISYYDYTIITDGNHKLVKFRLSTGTDIAGNILYDRTMTNNIFSIDNTIPTVTNIKYYFAPDGGTEELTTNLNFKKNDRIKIEVEFSEEMIGDKVFISYPLDQIKPKLDDIEMEYLDPSDNKKYFYYYTIQETNTINKNFKITDGTDLARNPVNYEGTNYQIKIDNTPPNGTLSFYFEGKEIDSDYLYFKKDDVVTIKAEFDKDLIDRLPDNVTYPYDKPLPKIIINDGSNNPEKEMNFIADKTYECTYTIPDNDKNDVTFQFTAGTDYARNSITKTPFSERILFIPTKVSRKLGI